MIKQKRSKVKLPAYKAGLHFTLRGRAPQTPQKDFYFLWGIQRGKAL